MGLFSKIVSKRVGNVVGKTLDIAKEAVTDKDAYYKLEHGLKELQVKMMLSGPGASITKITVCGLVSFVVGLGAYVFILAPELIQQYKDFCRATSPLITTLIGVYGTGRAFKNSKWSK